MSAPSGNVSPAQLSFQGTPLHPDPALRRGLERRVELLRRMAACLPRELPWRLGARVGLEQVARDPWGTEELRSSCRNALEGMEKLGAAWLESLEPVAPPRLDDAPLVVVVDAAPPDLWIAVEERLKGVLDRAGGRSTISWRRLEASPETADALAAMLGLVGDPVVELDARGIPYLTVTGDEPGDLSDLAGPLSKGTAAVIRIATLDRRAHAGEATLQELADLLDGFVSRRLEALLASCRSEARRLLLSTDHGLSLSRGRLVHGRGGAYERAIFVLEWTA